MWVFDSFLAYCDSPDNAADCARAPCPPVIKGLGVSSDGRVVTDS
jgi:hypothetical protein